MNAAQPPPPPRQGEPLSEIIHGRSRLLILSHLVRTGSLSFTQLRQLTGLSDGTLSAHLTTLEKAGIVTAEKSFVGKRPRTLISLTDEGAQRFGSYVDELKRIVPGLGE